MVAGEQDPDPAGRVKKDRLAENKGAEGRTGWSVYPYFSRFLLDSIQTSEPFHRLDDAGATKRTKLVRSEARGIKNSSWPSSLRVEHWVDFHTVPKTFATGTTTSQSEWQRVSDLK